MKKEAPTPMTSGQIRMQIEQVEADLVAAQAELATIAIGESAALASDETFTAWFRGKRVAEGKVEALTANIAALEVSLDELKQAEELEAYSTACDAMAARNAALADRYRTEMPAAWKIISSLMRDMAQAEIDGDRLERTKPGNFSGSTGTFPVHYRVRSRGSLPEQVLSDEIVLQWVDPQTGGLWHSQEAVSDLGGGRGVVSADFGTKKIELQQRRFRRVRKHPWLPAPNNGRLWEDLRFPTIDPCPRDMFVGRFRMSPEECIRRLEEADNRIERRDIVESIEPIDAYRRSGIHQEVGPIVPTEPL